MSRWGRSEIGDQTGRTFIVTGGNGGLGAETVRALATAGADVVLACRSVAKGEQVAAELGGRARVRELDLADLASVREFAEGADRADVLINNAGVMALPERRTVNGFEMQIGTNHLGHFALTGWLLDKISERIVTVSSYAHQMGEIDMDDLNWERRKYQRWSAYAQAKLANLLFARELQRRLTAAGVPKISVAVHPGYAATELQSHTETIQDKILAVSNRLMAQSAAMGALPTLYAATADVEPGGYYGPTGFGGMRGAPGPANSSKASKDEQLAGELWELSEKLTGVVYSFNS
ncbi:oxidoreductase [Nocardia sp. CNY236]|uniref:oxidoreductase n=1 Tax=Nocardia sp. CNY236 TaxID=1169152 RepID=UPI00049135AA|nr:oxidoreductase [Nocardia sp. CNY236]